MSYQVTAPLVLVRDGAGQVHHAYEGAVIQWLSPEQAKHLLSVGQVVEIHSAEADGDDGGVPHAAATKAELIAWLVEHAVKPDGGEYTAGALQPLNKDELRALIEAVD